MKFIAWFFGLLIALFIVIYIVAFTAIGNSILHPFIEENIQTQTKLDTKLQKFSLDMDDFEFIIELNKNNIVSVKGEYSMLGQSFDIKYDVKLDELKTLKSLTGVELRKSFRTSGTVKGDMSFIELDGVSDVASSETTYHVELTELNPTSITAKVQNLKLEELLEIGAQKSYAIADVNLDVNFKSIKTNALDGYIEFATSDGKINEKVMKNDFNITIPPTKFAMNLDAKLNGADVDYKYILSSNLFNANTSGKVTPTPLKTDIVYGVDIKELALLKPITGADVRGAFKLNGKVKGTKEKLVIDGKSDVASSDTRFEAILKDFNPASVKATMKNLRLEKVLHMVNQPHYADGVFSLHVDIPNAKMGELKGSITSSIRDGLLDSKYMTKAYEFKTPMPKTKFKLDTVTKLDGDILDTKMDFISTLANLNIKKAVVNTSDSSIISDYTFKANDLSKLFFVTEQPMRGSIVANGELKKAKDLDLTMHSNIVGGKMDVKLHNDDLHVDMLNMQTLKILHMLVYPEIFQSSLNAKLDYNLALKKGDFDGHLVDGRFSKNNIFGLLKKYASFDIYKETYKGDVSAKINQEKILATLELVSRKSSLKTVDTKIDSASQTIDSRITIVGNKQPVIVTLKGNLSSPKASIDMKSLIASKAGDKAKKALGKFLKKKGISGGNNDKVTEGVGNLLNKFF